MIPSLGTIAPFSAVLFLPHLRRDSITLAKSSVSTYTLSRKRKGRHPMFGTVYFCGLAFVFVSASGLSFVRWAEDHELFLLGTLAFASVGLLAQI
jgi:hypothetical protein